MECPKCKIELTAGIILVAKTEGKMGCFAQPSATGTARCLKCKQCGYSIFRSSDKLMGSKVKSQTK